MSDDGWYWCLDHGTAEQSGGDCPPDRRLGPYPSEEAARHWKEKVESRNEKWEADDQAWENS